MEITSEPPPVFVPVLRHSACVNHFAVSSVLGFGCVQLVIASALLCYRTSNSFGRTASCDMVGAVALADRKHAHTAIDLGVAQSVEMNGDHGRASPFSWPTWLRPGTAP